MTVQCFLHDDTHSSSAPSWFNKRGGWGWSWVKSRGLTKNNHLLSNQLSASLIYFHQSLWPQSASTWAGYNYRWRRWCPQRHVAACTLSSLAHSSHCAHTLFSADNRGRAGLSARKVLVFGNPVSGREILLSEPVGRSWLMSTHLKIFHCF